MEIGNTMKSRRKFGRSIFHKVSKFPYPHNTEHSTINE